MKQLKKTLKTGARDKLTPKNPRFVMHKVKNNPRIIPVKVTIELKNKFAIKLNPETVRRVIRSHGNRVARRNFR